MKKEQEAKKINKSAPPVGGRTLNKTNPFTGELGSLSQSGDDQAQQTSYDASNSALPIGTASRIFRKVAIMELAKHEALMRKKAYPLSDQVPGVKDPSMQNGTAGAPWSGAGEIQNLNFNNNPNKRYEEDEWNNMTQVTQKMRRSTDGGNEIVSEDWIDPGQTIYTGDE
jgi:hypothetical protein